jgi:hypothetical protein
LDQSALRLGLRNNVGQISALMDNSDNFNDPGLHPIEQDKGVHENRPQPRHHFIALSPCQGPLSHSFACLRDITKQPIRHLK